MLFQRHHNWNTETVQIVNTFLFAAFQLVQNVEIHSRIEVFETQVLQFHFDIVETHSVCQRHEQSVGFLGNSDLFFRWHRIQCPHVVKTVGKFYDNHSHVFGQGEHDFFEVFGLSFLVFQHTADFRQTIDNLSDFRSKHIVDVIERDVGVFDNIVQQCGNY